jgi:uncharacterized membrane protein YjjP (DUF1212 family)
MERPVATAPESVRFLVKLARGLHMYGTPSHRIEQLLEVATERLGIPSQFFSLPTVILAAFGAPEQGSTSLIRVEPGTVDLEKLVLLDDVMKLVLSGQLDVREAEARVDAIEAKPPQWGVLATIAAFAVSCCCAALFFRGSLQDVICAGAVGTVIAALSYVRYVRPGFQRVFQPTAAFLASFLATLAASRVDHVSASIVTIASLVVLLPGLALTMAMSELAAQSLVSGTVRLVNAAVVLLELSFGVAIGYAAAARLFDPIVGVEPPPLPAWTIGLALLIAPCTYTILFRAMPRDLVPILLAGLIGFAGDRLASAAITPEIGSFFGAFAVAIASNLHARWRDRPVAVTLVPGLLLLVPGSVGFRGALFVLEHDVVSGIEAAFRMLIVAAALVAGLLFANVMVPVRHTL